MTHTLGVDVDQFLALRGQQPVLHFRRQGESLLLANSYQSGHTPATAALPSTPEVGDHKSAFMKIASAMLLIPVVKLEGSDRLQLTLSGPRHVLAAGTPQCNYAEYSIGQDSVTING